MKVWTIRKHTAIPALAFTIIILFALIYSSTPNRPASTPGPLMADVIDLKVRHKDFQSFWLLNYSLDSSSEDWTSTDSNVPIITLFTTFKVSDRHSDLNMNTLRLWASLKPAVRPVLFYTEDDDKTFLTSAKLMGWLAYPVPKLREGTPVLKDMFKYVINHVTPKSFFIGYANSDIVFTEDLNRTLTYISHIRWYQMNGQGLLLVGQRYDALLDTLKPIKGPISINHSKDLRNKYRNGTVFQIDYFITTPQGFPFDSLPDFVVGKPGYDNWIVSKALEWQIRAIDCTETITALHQIRRFPNDDRGWFSKKACINIEIVKPFALYRGRTHCTVYFTNEFRDSVLIYQRLTFNKGCHREPKNETVFYERCSKLIREKTIQMNNLHN